MDILHAIILGAVQGITEWLPISSEGMIVLLQTTLFHGTMSVREMVSVALFLHLGTLLAAVVYYRKQVWTMVMMVFVPNKASPEERAVFWFLFIATALTGVVALSLVGLIGKAIEDMNVGQAMITGIIGLFLVITGVVQIINKRKKAVSVSRRTTPNWKDAIVVGVAQGFAIIPGLSRSGLTISALLLRGINDTQALSLSFLMSIPAVLAGNIVLNIHDGSWSIAMVAALVVAFVIGLASIHGLLGVAKRVEMGKFVLGFGVLMVCAAIVI